MFNGRPVDADKGIQWQADWGSIEIIQQHKLNIGDYHGPMKEFTKRRVLYLTVHVTRSRTKSGTQQTSEECLCAMKGAPNRQPPMLPLFIKVCIGRNESFS